jgi:tetratricopeptide (TPR) repeat protein
MSHTERGRILLSQSRYDQAEKELRLAIASDPDRPLPYSLLAMALSKQKKHRDAISIAQHGVHLSPDWAFTHYVLASVLDDVDRLDDALRSIHEAIRLDPEDADFYAMLASIHFQKRNWEEALKAAQDGLAIDPENVDAINLHAMALNKLGRQNEAGAAIDSALSKEPENASSHANQGWTWLQRNEPEKAMESFKEALRINPHLEWAREGILEALKAKNAFYRMLLRYFFWTSRLSSKAQWILILGLFFGSRILRGIAKTNPELGPVIYPILFLYAGFVILTWCSDPLFNLFLRLHPFGKLALSNKQKMASNFVGILFGIAILFLAIFAFKLNFSFLAAALVSILLMIPISVSFQIDAGKRRIFIIIYTMILVLLYFAGVASIFISPQTALVFFGISFLGIFLFQWIALIMLRV